MIAEIFIALGFPITDLDIAVSKGSEKPGVVVLDELQPPLLHVNLSFSELVLEKM